MKDLRGPGAEVGRRPAESWSRSKFQPRLQRRSHLNPYIREENAPITGNKPNATSLPFAMNVSPDFLLVHSDSVEPLGSKEFFRRRKGGGGRNACN